MLVDRLRTSAILISVVVVLIYLDSTKSAIGAEGLWLLPLLLFFSLGTAWDLCGLVLESGRALSRRFTLITTAIITLSAAVPMLWTLSNSPYPGDCPVGRVGWIAIGTITAVLLTFGLEMWTYGKPEIKREKGASIDRTLSGVFVSVYVGLPMALFVSLRGMGTGNWGLAALITMIAVTKSSDAGAYFSGRALGKRKLIPRLSPGKTWEGAIGGIIASTIVAFACLLWLFPAIVANHPNMGAQRCSVGALVLGPVLAIAGMLGDLSESLVKRDAGAKDSGDLLPGLGGVWDVTDSLIAAIMPAFLCFAAGVAGPPA